jgi:hypothetical protein
MLVTRGALTTFSIANDVAKYFAILPAAFIAVYPQLAALNIMGLSNAAERRLVGQQRVALVCRPVGPTGSLPVDLDEELHPVALHLMEGW